MLALPWPRLTRLRLTEGHGRPELRSLVESELWRRLDVIELEHVSLPSGDQPALTAAVGCMAASRLSLSSWQEGCDLIGAVADAPDWGRLRDLRITGGFARSRSSLAGS